MNSSNDADRPRADDQGARARGALPKEAGAPSAANEQRDELEEIEADGRHPGALRRSWEAQTGGRRIFVVVGALLTLVGSALVVWFALSATVSKPNWRDVSFTVVDDGLVQMSFQLTKPPQMTVECTILAQEVSHGVVGRTVLTIGPTATAATVQNAQIRTTSLAVIGTVRSCAQQSP